MMKNLENGKIEQRDLTEIKKVLEKKLEKILESFGDNFNPLLASMILSGNPVDGGGNTIVKVKRDGEEKYAIKFNGLMQLKDDLSRSYTKEDENNDKINLELLELGACAEAIMGNIGEYYGSDDCNTLLVVSNAAKRLKEKLGCKEISGKKLNELAVTFKKYSEWILSSSNYEDNDFPLEEYYNKIKNCDPYVQCVYFALTHPRIKEIFQEEKRKDVEEDIKDYVFEKMKLFKEIVIDLKFIAELDQLNERQLYQSIKDYEKTWQDLNDKKLEEFWKQIIEQIDSIPYKFYEFSVENNFFCVKEKEEKKTFEEIKGYATTKENLKRIPLETNKTILIYGPAGVGKTVMAEAFINHKLKKKEAFLAFEIGKTVDNISINSIKSFLGEYILDVVAKDKRIIIKCDEVDGKVLGKDRGETIKRLEELEKEHNNISWVFTSNIEVGEKYNNLTIADDASVMRRYSHHEYMDLPKENERKEILEYYLELHFGDEWKKYKKKERTIRKFAKETKNYSGWEIETMVRKAKEIGEGSDIEKMLKKGKEYIEHNYREGLEKRKMENYGIDTNSVSRENNFAPFSPKKGLVPYTY